MNWFAVAVLLGVAHILIERAHFPAVPVLMATAVAISAIVSNGPLLFRPWRWRRSGRTSTAVSVRPIAAGDVDVVAGMGVELSRHHGFKKDLDLTLQRLRAWIGNPNTPNKLIVAVTDNDEIVGYAHYLDQCATIGAEPYRRVTELFVAKDKRNCGIGRAIMMDLRHNCKVDGINLLAIEVMYINLVARGFYKRLGLHAEKRLTYFDIVAVPQAGTAGLGNTMQSATGQAPTGSREGHPTAAA